MTQNIKIASIVQLNQGDTKINRVVVARENDVLEVVHEDELDCKPMLAPVGIFHESDISHRDRAFLLTAFADTKRGKEIVRSLTR